ncbi:MAG: zinc-binding protein [Bacteroidetes bacterium]|nr:MAG: zinc-binding protein [Bacteroidota bacterium]
MSTSCECECGAAPKLIFSCSGAADVGAISDLTARKMSKAGVGKMFCLAGIGGRVSGIIKTTEVASKILAIDGCPLDCAKNSLENAGFKEFEHIRVTDCGFEKGGTEVNEENVAKVVDKASKLLE